MLIWNLFRFLRRLEQALKSRHRSQSNDRLDENSDVADSPKASTPFLSDNIEINKQRSSFHRFSRQRGINNREYQCVDELDQSNISD